MPLGVVENRLKNASELPILLVRQLARAVLVMDF